MKTTHRIQAAFTLVELLVTLAIIGTLIALLLPAVQNVREAARRLDCSSRMRQSGLALHLFHDAHGVFPASGWTRPGPGNASGKYVGWRPLILPFLEQNNLHQIYDFEQNWWEGSNVVAASVPVPIFRCPSAPSREDVLSAVAKPPRPAINFENPIAPTDYEAIMGVQPRSLNLHFATPRYNAVNRFSVLHRNSRTKFGDVRDGTSNTVAIVECGGRPDVYRAGRRVIAANDQGIGWADSEGPFSLDGAASDGSREGCGPSGDCVMAANARNDNEPYSFHLTGMNALFADGHVQYVAETIDLKVFAAKCTRDAQD